MPIFLPTLWQDKDTPLNFHQKHMKAIKAPVVSMEIRDANWDCVVPFFLNLSIKMQILFNRYWNICLVLREAKYIDEALLSTGSPGKEIWQLTEHEPIEAEQALSENETAAELALTGACPTPKGCSLLLAGPSATSVSKRVLSFSQHDLPHPHVRCRFLPTMQGHVNQSGAELEKQRHLFGVENMNKRSSTNKSHLWCLCFTFLPAVSEESIQWRIFCSSSRSHLVL